MNNGLIDLLKTHFKVKGGEEVYKADYQGRRFIFYPDYKNNCWCVDFPNDGTVDIYHSFSECLEAIGEWILKHVELYIIE